MDFFGNQNLNQNEILNVVAHKGTSFPVTPVVGQFFYRTDSTPKKLYIFLGAGVPGTTSGWFDLCHAYYA